MVATRQSAMKSICLSAIIALTLNVAGVCAEKAPLPPPSLGFTTTTQESLVLIRGLPFRVGKFCADVSSVRSEATPQSFADAAALLLQGGDEGHWVERAVSEQFEARFESSTW